MKKLLVTLLIALSVFALISCDHEISGSSINNEDGNEKQATTGTAEVLSTAGRTECEWVQLWENGTKWAKFNVGATVTSYENQATASSVNVGIKYQWGASTPGNYLTLYNRIHSNSTESIQGTASDTAKTLWGDKWKMPTLSDYEQLTAGLNIPSPRPSEQTVFIGTNVVWTWCDGSSTQYEAGCELQGWKISGIGDYAENSIFFVAYPIESFWTADAKDQYNAKMIQVSSGGYFYTNNEDKGYDYYVRPILAE